METVRVQRDRLVAILKDNRQTHKTEFIQAVEGYRKKLLALLEEHVENVRAGRTYSVRIDLPEPIEHTKDYDREIQMLALSVDEIIELKRGEFAQYVMDDWAWKGQFSVTNALYTASR